MAIIDIVDLRVRTIIGTKPWERKNKQEIILNVSLEYDAAKAAQSDDLKDAVDYERLANMVVKTVKSSRCQLLESLAARVIKQIKGCKGLQKVSLRIDKPLALPEARCVSYKVTA